MLLLLYSFPEAQIMESKAPSLSKHLDFCALSLLDLEWRITMERWCPMMRRMGDEESVASRTRSSSAEWALRLRCHNQVCRYWFWLRSTAWHGPIIVRHFNVLYCMLSVKKHHHPKLRKQVACQGLSSHHDVLFTITAVDPERRVPPCIHCPLVTWCHCRSCEFESN